MRELTKPNDTANPVGSSLIDAISNGHYNSPYVTNYTGLTKREHFAAMAMQGMWAGITDQYYNSYDVISEMAVKQADALINELNKTQS